MDEREDVEAVLRRLMPVGMSAGAVGRIEEGFCEGEVGGGGELEEGGEVIDDGVTGGKKYFRWAGFGAAAAVVVVVWGVGAWLEEGGGSALDLTKEVAGKAAGIVSLAEMDRVEGVTDEGLYVDAGGSAVRKVRVRVVEESRVRDEETGIVVMLTEPREELYLLPVSTF